MYKTLAIRGNVLPLNGLEAVLAGLDALHDLVLVFAEEGRVAGEQDVQEDSAGPDVGGAVKGAPQDLRGEVVAL